MGTGEYLEKFPKWSIGIDVSDENIHIASGKGLKVINADINQGLPFADSSFKTVFCSHVIEHVDSPLDLLRESKRVLNTNGNLILAIPIEKTLVGLFTEGYFKGHKTHICGFSIEGIDSLLKKAGLQIIEKFYNFPIVNRIFFIDRILQFFRGNYCQYISTMYWIVARKITN